MLKYSSNSSTGKKTVIEFTTESDAIRKVFWNDNGATLSLEMDNGVIQEIGKQQFYSVKNNSANTIVKGSVLSYSGAVGANGVVHVKLASSSESASLILGVASEDISVNDHGLCTSFGVLQDMNTTGSIVSETWSSGDMLYLNPTLDGSLTKTKPSSPNIKISVGIVVEEHATLGVLLVRVDQGNLLEDNHDVQLLTPADGEILSYNSSNGRWENSGVVNVDSTSFSGNLSVTDTDVQTALDTIDAMTAGGVELGETSVTAYRGDRGKTAYDHSQVTHAPSNAQKNSYILKSEIEAKLTGIISTHSHTGTVTGSLSGVCVDDYGALGNGTTDDTAAIQSAFDDNDEVYFSTKTYLVNADVSLKPNNNQKIHIPYNCTIKMATSPNQSYKIFLIDSKSDISITVEGIILGDLDTHGATGGEWGMGISVLSSYNIHISVDGNITKCWGDGVYVGGTTVSKNINIRGTFNGNRRQGLTVVNANGFVIEDVVANDTSGTDPQSGVILEPNSGGIVKNGLLKNISCRNNTGDGIHMYGTLGTIEDIKVINCSAHLCEDGLRATGVKRLEVVNFDGRNNGHGFISGGAIEDVLVRDSDFSNSSYHGIYISVNDTRFSVSNTVFENCKSNENGVLAADNQSAAYITANSGDVRTVRFINCELKDTRSIQRWGIYVAASGTVGAVFYDSDCILTGNTGGAFWNASRTHLKNYDKNIRLHDSAPVYLSDFTGQKFRDTVLENIYESVAVSDVNDWILLTKGATVTLSTGTIPATGWVDNTGDYDKKLDFDISGIVAADWVDIAVDKDSIDIASDAEICPTVEEYAGGITVFAQYVPASSISISYKIVHT